MNCNKDKNRDNKNKNKKINRWEEVPEIAIKFKKRWAVLVFLRNFRFLTKNSLKMRVW